MMKRSHPLDKVLRSHLCTGCGSCVGICPHNAIRMLEKEGLYLPVNNNEKCRHTAGCSLCYRVCPGRKVAIDAMADELFSGTVTDSDIGRHLNCHTGYSTDQNIRYHATSGGVTSQLLIYLLENKLISAALVTKFNPNNPLEPEVFIAKTRDEIFEARGSKYCPVPLGIGLRDILKHEGRYAVVGLPCHIHAFRKAEKIFPRLKNRIMLYLGIYCSSTKKFSGTEYILKHFKINPADILSFSYRDEGYLGNMVIKSKNGSVKRWPYVDYYPLIRSFFIPYRCTLCIDHTAELADISLGDIYIPEYWNDKIGVNSLIVRSARGETYLKMAIRDGAVVIQPLDKALLIKSQKGMLERKKGHTRIRMILLRMLGMNMPVYDCKIIKRPFKQNFRFLVSTLVLYTEILIGKFYFLWFIIDECNLRVFKKK